MHGARVTRRIVAGLVTSVLLTMAPAHAEEPMPAQVAPGSWTQPTYAARDVPGYVAPGRLEFRLGPGAGAPNASYAWATPGGTQTLLGDWNGDGTHTPARFLAGTWTISDTLVASRRTRTVPFGRAGDRPVVGDWNGDGLTDLGVVRGRTWHLALGSGAEGAVTTWRWVTFGPPNALVLAGDWDGDGRDGLAAFVDGRWLLRQSIAGTRSWSVTLGRSGDVPVAGDWNGDGVDSPAVVRRALWTLRAHPRAGASRTTQRRVQRAGDRLPLAWTTTTGPRAAACPTARSQVPSLSGLVRPPRTLDRAPTAPEPEPVTLLRTTLASNQRFLLQSHYDSTWARRRTQPWVHVMDGGRGSFELSVRPPAMTAAAVAIALRTGVHLPRRTGRSAEEATAYVDWLVRSIACQHDSVTPGGWGNTWQSAHWAQLTGLAAWLMWDRLTPQTRDYVAAMMTSEADRVAALPVKFWMLADGTIASPGNTHAEELAWDTAALELAVQMMPTAPRASAWRQASVQFAAAAYARPADLGSARLVNGVALRDRLQGANAHDDGSVENHGIIHPDYASNIQQLWWAASFAGLARRRVPEAMFHNGARVYDALSGVSYTAGAASPAGGTFLAPGGTVYRVGASDVYYPQGSTWGTARRAHWVSLDAQAWALSRLMPLSGWSAEQALEHHLAGQRALMSTSQPDGATYSSVPSVALAQDAYPGREEYAAQQLATAWLALYVARVAPPSLDRSMVPVPVPPASRRPLPYDDRETRSP